MTPFAQRIDAVDHTWLRTELDTYGAAVLPRLLHEAECTEFIECYGRTELFRKRVMMARHNYGRGEYQYFAYPLPPQLEALRSSLYPLLVPVANAWSEALGSSPFPDSHQTFLERCHAAGQAQPTPLLLRYTAGDYNCLHQDLYGEHVFPLQVAILLSDPRDFTGGEFVMTEQRARRQSRAMVVPLARGDAVVFAVNQRPVASARGVARAQLRHGVSLLRFGSRLTLGVIFHDAA
jgi:uncharacterized protein